MTLYRKLSEIHTLSILLPVIFHHKRFTHPYIDTSFQQFFAAWFILVKKLSKPGRWLTLQCSQPQPKIATCFDLFKWRHLADNLDNTWNIMRERTGLWFPVFYQLTLDPGSSKSAVVYLDVPLSTSPNPTKSHYNISSLFPAAKDYPPKSSTKWRWSLNKQKKMTTSEYYVTVLHTYLQLHCWLTT